jgi:hypothetical protein
MQKYLSIILPILFLWISSCDHEESTRSEATEHKKITLTDLDHEPVVRDLLAKIQNPVANGRISTLEIADAFFKYSEPDSGILNYTFRLPDDSPDYFENLVLSQYEDGFYGFIYRYIPDGPYIAGDSFKGTFQQYNLTGELILEFTTSTMPDSVSAGGRVQLLNQCVKSIDQTCTTIYEVETRTDYPCHCQYDHKTEVSTVCTFSFNRGWCDDMTGIPPAGGGGTYVGASDATPRSGGSGGSTGTITPKLVKKNPVVVVPEPGFDDITFNNVKSPCLVKVVKNLMREDFKNNINRHVKRLFVDAAQVQNLDFTEIKTLVNSQNEPVHARTMLPTGSGNSQTHIEIRLNGSTLPGTSYLFQIIAIYHETVHSFLMMDRGFASYVQEAQHELMSDTTHIQLMISAVQDIYGRTLTNEESKRVAAVWLYGFEDAQSSDNFKNSLAKWNLTFDDILTIGSKEENVVIDKDTGKIKSVGGSNCLID